MKAEIVSIGTEMLLGQTLNTNSAYLSRKLAESGIDTFHHSTVGDNKDRLYQAIKIALERSDMVITTGGLGPTIDDITLQAIARISKKPLVFKKEILELIEGHFHKRSIRMPKNNIRQAYIPKGAIWLKNAIGTAPGLIIKAEKKYLIALPGPPREMIPMFEKRVLPYFKKRIKQGSVILSRTLKTTGLAESQIHDRVSRFLRLAKHTTVGIYAHPCQIDLRITSKAANISLAKKNIDVVERAIRKKLGNLIFGSDNQTLEGVVAGLLAPRTIAIAESCTGGLITSRLTDIAGVSKNLLLSIVAYSNKSKTQLLGIQDKTLKQFGAVSKEIARYMAVNIRHVSRADIGISTTGIAGPGGATDKKPVGLVYIGLSTKQKTTVKKLLLTGTRGMIKYKASQAALDMLKHHLSK
jgi:nicotinamide-nucleotide amidase